MSMEIFSGNYSNVYDIIYETKDYEAECDFLEEIFKKNNKTIKTILDLGCGTGSHLIALAKRGYQVTGVDQSQYMLDCAQEKINQNKVKADLIRGDICSVNLETKFDAIISMFAVMSYQVTNKMLSDACSNPISHLKPAGMFIFDGWHGPGVLTDKPVQSYKIIHSDNKEIIRFTEPIIDIQAQTVENRFKLWVKKGDQVLTSDDESHLVRFFFPQEIQYFLTTAGFSEVSLCPFMELDGKLNSTTWNMTVIASA